MPPTSKVKAKQWGKADKRYLFDLVTKDDINITGTSYTKISRTSKGSNFPITTSRIPVAICDFAASIDLKTEYNSAS
jgi:hypothetical protein